MAKEDPMRRLRGDSLAMNTRNVIAGAQINMRLEMSRSLDSFLIG
jgi:hypothetical protein